MSIRSRILGGGDESIRRARRPQELAASRGRAALEGLRWLGRRPGPRAGLLYRLLLAAGEFILYRVCAIRLLVDGRRNVPTSGGYIVAAALHRSWVDPILLLGALPREPRVWFLGSAATAFDKAWKERLLRHTGGMLPVWRGGADVEIHVEAARAVVDEGAVLALFIEGAIIGPPDRVQPGIRSGSGLLALRTDAPIVPFALANASDLYRGRRICARILPPVSVAELLGDDARQLPIAPGTREELRLARRLTHALAQRIDAELPELIERSTDPPDHPRRWRWLTRLFR